MKEMKILLKSWISLLGVLCLMAGDCQSLEPMDVSSLQSGGEQKFRGTGSPGDQVWGDILFQCHTVANSESRWTAYVEIYSHKLMELDGGLGMFFAIK